MRASRSLTAELSPPVLRQGTLADIMRWLIQWMRERHDLEVHAKIDDHVDTQAEEIRALLFEASRELLFNVVKHAGVRQACLELARLRWRVGSRDHCRPGSRIRSGLPANRPGLGHGLRAVQH